MSDFLLVVNKEHCLVFEKIVFLCTRFWRQTDRRTDSQTDGQHHHVKPRIWERWLYDCTLSARLTLGGAYDNTKWGPSLSLPLPSPFSLPPLRSRPLKYS